MRILVALCAGVAGLLAIAAVVEPARSQTTFKTCTDAYNACVLKTKLAKECAAEKAWCRKTGTFADPVTKIVSTGLQKR